MARRRVLGQKELGMEEVKAGCKYHPEREAVVDRHGRSTGMCSECLSSFGKRGAVRKWQDVTTEKEPEYDPVLILPERIADAVKSLARPGKEMAVFELLMEKISQQVVAMLSDREGAA